MAGVMKTILQFKVDIPPITKKNHQRIVTNRSTGKPMVLPSKEFEQYERDAMWFIPCARQIDYKVNIRCLFYMPTKRRVDLTNLLEAIDDVMVKSELLKDDDFNIIGGHDGSRVLYDKLNPRTEVYIEEFRG